MIWVLIVFLIGTDVKEEIYFQDLDTCLEYSNKVQNQYIKAYCIPKKENK